MSQEATSTLEHPVLASVRALNDDLGKACGAELWQALDAEVEAALAQALAAESRLGALRAAMLREAEARGLRANCQALSTAGWLQGRFRISRSRADRITEQAAALSRHPQVEVALAGAALSEEHARIATTILDRAARLPAVTEPDLEASAELLVEHAGVLDPGRLRRAGEQLLEALAARAPSEDDPDEKEAIRRDEEAAENAARRAETNGLKIRRRRDGGLGGSFEFSPLGAATLHAWLKTADRPHPGADGFEDQRPRDQRRGDALIGALLTDLTASSQYFAGGCDDGTGATNSGNATAPPRARIGVTISLEALRAGLAGAGLLDTGGTLSAAELRRLACDAAIIPIVLAGESQILDVGRATRTWNPAQERGIYARDRACVAPGCDRPPATCQIHHQWEWARGGPTDLGNGALLCLFHHQQVHRQGWTITMARNGYPQLIPPASIDPDQRPRQHHRYRLTLLTGRHRT